MSDNIEAAISNQKWQEGKVHRMWMVYVRNASFDLFHPHINIHGEATAYRSKERAKHAAAQERRMRGHGCACIQEIGIV